MFHCCVQTLDWYRNYIMEKIFPHIDQRAAQYQNHAFLEHLRDSNVPADERLAYAPFAAHFVLTFSDLMRYIAHDDANPFASLLRQHAQDDALHLKTYFEDLALLGCNPRCTLVESLEFLSRPDGQRARALSHFAMTSVYTLDPRLRLVAFETIEATGAVWLAATSAAARDHALGDKLSYFGRCHVEREEKNEVERSTMIGYVIEDELRDSAHQFVDDFFDYMERFNDELFECAQRRVRQELGLAESIIPNLRRTSHSVEANP